MSLWWILRLHHSRKTLGLGLRSAVRAAAATSRELARWGEIVWEKKRQIGCWWWPMVGWRIGCWYVQAYLGYFDDDPDPCYLRNVSNSLRYFQASLRTYMPIYNISNNIHIYIICTYVICMHFSIFEGSLAYLRVLYFPITVDSSPCGLEPRCSCWLAFAMLPSKFRRPITSGGFQILCFFCCQKNWSKWVSLKLEHRPPDGHLKCGKWWWITCFRAPLFAEKTR